MGISFHGKADILEQILTEYPQIEVVQIQFNYVDYDDPAVESRKCYEVCKKHGMPVLGGWMSAAFGDTEAVGRCRKRI